MNQQTNETIKPWQLVTKSCNKFQAPSPSLMLAAHEQSRQEMQSSLAVHEAESVQINLDLLAAVTGLLAIDGTDKEEAPMSFLDVLDKLKQRGSPHDTQ